LTNCSQSRVHQAPQRRVAAIAQEIAASGTAAGIASFGVGLARSARSDAVAQACVGCIFVLVAGFVVPFPALFVRLSWFDFDLLVLSLHFVQDCHLLLVPGLDY